MHKYHKKCNAYVKLCPSIPFLYNPFGSLCNVIICFYRNQGSDGVHSQPTVVAGGGGDTVSKR